MRLTLICALVILASGCVAEEPAGIPVVSTYADLLKQTPVSFNENNGERLSRAGAGADADIKFRFGVEANHLPAGCGAVVYVVTEGYGSGAAVSDVLEEQAIGPLEIEFCSEGTEMAKAIVDSLSQQVLPENCWHGTLLFCQSIGADKPGRYVLKIKTPHSNHVLAQTTIELTEEGCQPWTSLAFPHELEKRLQDSIARVDLAFPGGETAIPKMDGSRPWVIDGQNEPGRRKKTQIDQLLPTLTGVKKELPEPKLEQAERDRVEALIAKLGSDSFDERDAASYALREIGLKARTLLEAAKKGTTDPEIALRAARLVNEFKPARFTAKREQNGFILITEHEFGVETLRDYILTRWWVNGKAVALETLAEKMIEESTHLRFANQVYLNLDIDYKALGTKSGDTIAVQFLFCPDGWRSSQLLRDALAEMVEREDEDSPELPALSNRVEWKAP
jgi:hypothetical protein